MYLPPKLLLLVLAASTVVVLLLVAPSVPDVEELNIAFVGNSITYVNDVPRFMEALSGGKVRQNSCLHGSLNLQSLLEKGNGMYLKWRHKRALLKHDRNGAKIYDYGACTVQQLLFGDDPYLSVYNQNEYYTNDGRNPCFQDRAYYSYIVDYFYSSPTPQWDMVVINDRTIYPALYETRQSSLQALKDYYVDLFLESGARPLFIMTYGHAIGKSSDDTAAYYYKSRLGDVPEFTSHLYYGYQQYASVLADALPESQQPLIAPVGLAFLYLWQENYGLWKRCFYIDNYHPSPHGTYLLGCVLYATMYGRMPPTTTALPKRIETLWQRARKMEVTRKGPVMDIPTLEEAAYLYQIAERVTLQGHVPSALLDMDQVMEIEQQQQQQQEEEEEGDG